MHRSLVAIAALSLVLQVALCACPKDTGAVTRWSTWSGKPTASGAVVTIPAGERVLLDVSPGKGLLINKIDIHGELIFDDIPIELDAEFIYVHDGGHLWIGSKDCPVRSKMAITLFGLTQDPKSNPPLLNANKVLGGFSGSQIDIHGVPGSPTWTVLAKTAEKGDNSITVAEDITWKMGDQIVIASTDFSYWDSSNPVLQSEVREITHIEGRTISFTQPLRFMHYGKIYTPKGDSSVKVDMRGEVGLLTRNILIQGDTTQGTTETDQWGGHILVEGNAQLRIDGVELNKMGQKDNMARYPIHFHLGGDQPNSYATRNSIHHSFQRAITIHGTNQLTIKDNVAYWCNGHMYFIEDGNEENNVLEHNLGIDAIPHTLLKPADSMPAVFWITNPNNQWINNVAVGGRFGFWFAMPRQPTGFGPSLTDFLNHYPRRQPINKFIGNKAHSAFETGVHIDDMLIDGTGLIDMAEWEPVDWSFISDADRTTLQALPSTNSRYVNLLEQYIAEASHRAYSKLEDITAYKNADFGIWGRGKNIHVTNAMLSDNNIGTQYPGDGNLFENSVIIGESDNIGNPEAFDANRMQGRSRPNRWDESDEIVGYRNYDAGGPDMVRNVKFFNFLPMKFFFTGKIRPAAAISVQGGNHIIAPRNKYYNLKFYNTPVRVFFEETDRVAHKGAVIKDVDGSITGDCGAEITTRQPIMYTDKCTHFPAWQAYVCGSEESPHHYFRSNDYSNNFAGTLISAESKVMQRARSSLFIWRLHDHAAYELQATGDEYADEYFQIRRDQMTVSMMANTVYLLQYGVNSETPNVLALAYEFAARDEWVMFAIPYPPGTTFIFSGSYDHEDFKAGNSIDEVDSTTYFYDTTTNLLWVKLIHKQEQFIHHYGKAWYNNRMSIGIVANCTNSVCTQPIEPTTIDHKRYDAPKVNKVCEAGGGIERGDFTWSKNSDSVIPVFDEEVDAEWRLYGDESTYSVSEDMAVSGTKSLLVDFNKWKSITFRRANEQKAFDPSGYTHLEFRVRTANGRGAIRRYMGVVAQGTDNRDLDETRFPWVDAANPHYTNEYPINDERWSTVRIPLTDLGMKDHGDIWSFRIWTAEDPRPTPTYLDNIRFVDLKASRKNVEPVIDIDEVKSTEPTYYTPLSAIIATGASTDDTEAVHGSGDEKAAEGVPAWAIAVPVVLGAMLIAAVGGAVFFFLKWKKTGGRF